MPPKVLVVDDNAELLGLVARVLEKTGYEVTTAQRARVALEKAKSERPDVAIVDVLLPDQMGYEVAAALRVLKIPFFLVSGVFKGGRQGLDAVQKHGAVEFVEKPFDLDLLVEKIARIAAPPDAAEETPDPGDDDIGAQPVDDTSEHGREVELTGRVSLTETNRSVSATLSGAPIKVNSPRPRASEPPPPRPSQTQPPPVMLQVAPISDTAGLLTAREGTPMPGSPPPNPASTSQADAVRSGELSDNLPNLITAFYVAQETGELICQRGPVKKVVYFEKGAPVFAASNLSTDRFGQFLVRVGKVPEDEVKAAMVVAEKSKRRTGDVLIEMGLLSDTERMYFVGQQVKAVVYSLFAWESGTWQLAFRRKARSESLKLDLHPANLITRGVRKLYRPERLAKLMPDYVRPIPGPDPAYLLSDVELEPWEAMLLPKADGMRTIAELVTLSGKPPDQVRGLFVGLLYLRIVDYAR